ncbi:MAG TPA: hypothetical protein VEB19_15675 [Gemmatimonadaceae bacterium]|nr:hypothetical protein [Gemmatimonadaceae bacterium]
MRLRHLAPLALLGWSCSDPVDPTETDDSIRQLPTELRFEAFANGQLPDGRDIQCSIETHIVITSEVAVAGNATIRTGTGGGDARRNKELANGNSVAFWATTGFQDLQVAYIGTDSIEIRSPASADVTERFWKEFARFAGSRRNLDPAQGVYAEGDWTCHPMDTPESSGEYYDAEGSMPGRWTLYRAHNPL